MCSRYIQAYRTPHRTPIVLAVTSVVAGENTERALVRDDVGTGRGSCGAHHPFRKLKQRGGSDFAWRAEVEVMAVAACWEQSVDVDHIIWPAPVVESPPSRDSRGAQHPDLARSRICKV